MAYIFKSIFSGEFLLEYYDYSNKKGRRKIEFKSVKKLNEKLKFINMVKMSVNFVEKKDIVNYALL